MKEQEKQVDLPGGRNEKPVTENDRKDERVNHDLILKLRALGMLGKKDTSNPFDTGKII